MEPFNHGYTNPLTEKSMNEILGYTKAMRDFYHLIKDETQFKPEKRMVDSVILLDTITATSDELQKIFQHEKDTIENMATAILSGTKPNNNERG